MLFQHLPSFVYFSVSMSKSPPPGISVLFSNLTLRKAKNSNKEKFCRTLSFSENSLYSFPLEILLHLCLCVRTFKRTLPNTKLTCVGCELNGGQHCIQRRQKQPRALSIDIGNWQKMTVNRSTRKKVIYESCTAFETRRIEHFESKT